MCTYPSGRRHPQLVIDEIADAVWAAQMNTITFHPWPVRTGRRRPARRAAHRPRPAAGARLPGRRRGRRRAARGDGRDRAHRVGQDLPATEGVHVYARVAPTHEFLDVRHGVIGIARELERRLPDLVTTVVVEGGARRTRSSSTSTRRAATCN